VDDFGVLVTALDVVDGDGEALALRVRGGDGGQQIGCKGGNAAFARQVVADEGDFADLRALLQVSLLS
jgi:hypothetical protein